MVIVAAVDRSERAKQVVAEGAVLAAAFGAPLHVVHVLSNAQFRELEQTSYNDTGQTIPMEEVKQFATKHADEVAADVGGDYEAVGLVGDAVQMVLEYAERNDARYVVVVGRKRSPTGESYLR